MQSGCRHSLCPPFFRLHDRQWLREIPVQRDLSAARPARIVLAPAQAKASRKIPRLWNRSPGLGRGDAHLSSPPDWQRPSTLPRRDYAPRTPGPSQMGRDAPARPTAGAVRPRPGQARPSDIAWHQPNTALWHVESVNAYQKAAISRYQPSVAMIESNVF